MDGTWTPSSGAGIAKQLAARIEDEAPTGSSVKIEGTWKAAYAERPQSPFAVLGGLAG
jgi:hypothetical protein